MGVMFEKAARPGADIELFEELRWRSHAAAVRLGVLTLREREVLRALALGASNKAAARLLDISPRTVEIHRAKLMKKLEARNLAEALHVSFMAALFER